MHLKKVVMPYFAVDALFLLVLFFWINSSFFQMDEATRKIVILERNVGILLGIVVTLLVLFFIYFIIATISKSYGNYISFKVSSLR